MPPSDPVSDAIASRPEIINARHVVSEVSTLVPLPIHGFHAWLMAAELEDILQPHGPIPAIVRSELVSGRWSEPGSRRRVFMADGSSVLEEVLEHSPPSYFAYIVWQLSGALGLLARYGHGEFFLEPAGAALTHVRWVYSFAPALPLSGPPLSLIVNSAFRPFMSASIARIREAAERGASERKGPA